jgi:AraC-like DNA-binding protein
LDVLSDLLRVVRLDGAYFFAVEAAGAWSVETAPAKDLSPRILPTSEHLISYHLLTAGRCYAGVRGEEQVELVAGDVILFPQGDAHLMSSRPGLRVGVDVRNIAPGRYPETVYIGEQGTPRASFFCGFLGLDRRPFNPLLAALPRRLHVKGMSSGWLQTFTHQLTEEARNGRPGTDTILTRLAELMFIEALRRYLEELPPGQTGWLAGLRDEVVGRVLTLLHARPAYPWTLDELAREVASSRTSVARRFTDVVGQPPMQYLTQWRMQVAANLLTQGGAKIAAIAADVGYDSEAAFSRAFKKATGLAPGAWRETRRASATREQEVGTIGHR